MEIITMENLQEIELPKNLEIYRDKIEASIKPYLEIELKQSKRPRWWHSKFGGLPYLPKGYDYPKNNHGEYLYLLAQINFKQTPRLQGFPDRGILQFYILPDDTYGMKFGSTESVENFREGILLNAQQDNFRVIYFPKVCMNDDKLITDFSFLPTIEEKDYLFPIEGSSTIDFTLQSSPIGINDYKFNIFSQDELSEDIYESLYEQYYDDFPHGGHQIGGYPDFTQDDPRSLLEDDEDPYILLFQMDTDGNDSIDIMWGDCGICNFFIKKSALEKLDFSQVLYNWDCG